MDQVIVISDGEDEDEEEEAGRSRKRQRSVGTSFSPALEDCIDLTEEDFIFGDIKHSDVGVIDLTSLEGIEDMQKSFETNMDFECESSSPVSDCLFIKEDNTSMGSSKPGVEAHTSRSPEVDLFEDGTSSESSSSKSNSSNDSYESRGLLSDSGTSVNSDLGSLNNPHEMHTSTHSSSVRSRRTSEESLSDLLDNCSKSSLTTSPAIRKGSNENISLPNRTASLNNSQFGFSRCDKDSLEDFSFISSSTDWPDTRPLLKHSLRISSKESCEENVSILSSKESSYDSEFISENIPILSSRETSCNSKSSLENLPVLSSRESSCERKSSLKSIPVLSSRESCYSENSLENLPVPFSAQKPSLENSPLVGSIEDSNSRHSTTNPSVRESSITPLLNFTLKELSEVNSSLMRTVQVEHPDLQSTLGQGVEHTRDLSVDPLTSCTPVIASRAWLNKLKYFRKLPIRHLFFQGIKLDKETLKNRQRHPVPISDRRLNMVNTTIEEDFSQGTLQFLLEFVSPQHYPPKDIVSHVVRKILLRSKDVAVLTDAYTVLMKIQELHPATIHTVVWDWSLLTLVMDGEVVDGEDKKIPGLIQNRELPGHLLFLRYMLQTLEDDFQTNLIRRSLQSSIAKTMLSCDRHFSNIGDVIRWLIDAVKCCSIEADCENNPPLSPDNTRNKEQMVVCILQQMLAMAVEVDKSPTMSSNKIAYDMFPYVPSMPQRTLREIFFNTIASHLLRAKVLELMFDNSCEPPPPKSCFLSRTKILYFLKHSTLLLDDKGGQGELQRWDEMLHHLFLLFISYESILLEHLRAPLIDRVDLTIHKAKAPLMDIDKISKTDVDLHLNYFCRRVSQRQEEISNAQIMTRIEILKTVLYSVVHCPPP
ncbi:SUMO-interacting motif-containing protein 1 [Lissotriton helveticus]